MSKHKSTGGLGFKDFRDFNMALLGKQGWRLATKSEGLASRLYKARYFPTVNFFESKIGQQFQICLEKHMGSKISSYVWGKMDYWLRNFNQYFGTTMVARRR